MVILITGASHTGKTLLAQRLIEKLHYPCLSIDHLKMGLIRSGNTALTPEDDDALTDYLWPIVREMVKTAIENRQNLIVEGCYIPFGWRRDFDEQYLKSIQFVCLAMSDTYIETHFEEIKAHASDVESRLDDSSCTVERLQAENRAFAAGFRESGEPIVLIDQDFKSTVNGLLSHICRIEAMPLSRVWPGGSGV
jgi:2-phosphoglycerate kinase